MADSDQTLIGTNRTDWLLGRRAGATDRPNSMIDMVNAFALDPPMLAIPGATGVVLALGLVFMP